MSQREELARTVADAEADVLRIREANARLAEDFRLAPTDDAKEGLKRAALSLASARDRVDAAKAALAVFDETGSPYGIVAGEGKIVGTIAVLLKPGTSREDREAAIDAELLEKLHDAANELGVVVAAKPSSYTRERPGRDEGGRTILEVAGVVEGDRLIPAVSRAAKSVRR